MFRIHILDISSIIQLNWNLMMSIRAPMRHKIVKWADRKSKMATTAAILKINFRHLFSNLRSLWAETCSLATGWFLNRNKLKLCRSKIQDGRSGSAPLNKMAAWAKKKIANLQTISGLISKYLHKSISTNGPQPKLLKWLASAENRKQNFKRLLLRSQCPDFKVISQKCSSYDPLPKLLKKFCSAKNRKKNNNKKQKTLTISSLASGLISKCSSYPPLPKLPKWFCSAEQNGHQS